MPDVTAGEAVSPRGGAELFVYLRLATAGKVPLLADEDVAQAAQTALSAHARMHRCRVLAVGSDRNILHIVLQFPASLSLKLLVSIVRDASAVAVARLLSLERQEHVRPESVWSGPYQLDTLSPGDVPATIDFVCHHVGRPVPEQLAWSDFIREANAAYGDGSLP